MSDSTVSVIATDSGAIDWYSAGTVPVVIDRAGGQARKRFLEFFTATIRNLNTRAAYARAVTDFATWCAKNDLDELRDLEPVHIAAYIEGLQRRLSAPP